MNYIPRPKSKFKPMSMAQRAAQFAPFAALKGYEESIAQASRNKEAKRELSEEQQEELNEIFCQLKKMDTVQMECFQQDHYVTICGKIKKVDLYNLLLCLQDGRKIDMHQIYSIIVL